MVWQTNINKHLKVFNIKCYIKNKDEKSGKFDVRVDEGIFLGYSREAKGTSVIIKYYT